LHPVPAEHEVGTKNHDPTVGIGSSQKICQEQLVQGIAAPQNDVSSVKLAQCCHDLQQECLLSQRRLISAVAVDGIVYFPRRIG